MYDNKRSYKKTIKNVCIYIMHLNRLLKYYTLYDQCTKSLNVLRLLFIGNGIVMNKSLTLFSIWDNKCSVGSKVWLIRC